MINHKNISNRFKKIFYLLSVLTAITLLTLSAYATEVNFKGIDSIGYNYRLKRIEQKDKPITSLHLKSDFLKRENLPAVYDSRDCGVVTPIKNQEPYGSCYAFAAIACAESNIISENKIYSADSLDLSEVHHAYFTYNTAADKLNLTMDKIELNKYSFLDVGGNSFTSTNVFSKWFGPSTEEIAPYSEVNESTTLSPDKAYSDNIAILENAYWVDIEDIDSIKRMVMKNGAVSVSYYSEDTLPYYNEAYSSYYCNRNLESNHQVTIVGWDDNFSRRKFGYSIDTLLGVVHSAMPEKNGAWLIKGSYGTEYGDNGYIWISYYDKSLCNDIACAYDFQPTTSYDNNYQYDGGIFFSEYYSKNKIYGANVFTANGNEILKAIGIFSYDDTANYKYQIYLNPDKDNPSSGIPVFSSYQDAKLIYSGYNTVVLPYAVQLSAKDRFSVVVLSENHGKTAYIMSDISGDLCLDGSVIQKTTTKRGQSFLSYDNKKWQDACDFYGGENIKIKAFTCNGLFKPTSVSSKSVSILYGKTAQISVTAKPEFYVRLSTLKFSSSNTKVASVSNEGLIKSNGVGSCNITITSKADPSVKTTIKVTVKPGTPSSLKEAKQTESSITLNWSKVSGAKYYKVERSTDGKKWNTVTTTSKTSYTVSKLKAGTKYQFRVTALDSTKKITGKASTVLKTGTLTKAPTLKLKSTKSKTATASWGKVTGAKKYIVYKSTNGKKWTKVTTTTKTSYNLTKLTGRKKIYVRVTAVNAYGKASAYSNAKSVTVKK